ncbi:MAG: hypothetical protein KBH99_07635 [Syntrophobacteraceae bacterium]|nr:hypothetical protein [Syntrophobacteraceae bacterium]
METMKIRSEDVQGLRMLTDQSVSLRDCKRALTECNGDREKALSWLREQGILKPSTTKFGKMVLPPRGSGPGWSYVYVKAQHFLKMNPEVAKTQWKRDFGVPEEHHEKVRSGLEQILAGAGREQERPLRDIGIEPFYGMVRVLGLEVVEQMADFRKDGILDHMILEQPMMGMRMTIFNLVENRWDAL